ncbi:hypothetical protein C8035_v011194 [Colletotrichum spinosum]|uniref:Uncharacterized protein n=1 Tax=Colletotrichum spinosum TaxID=1347390 RepID=A0A4R8Q5M6_9PEZI|nr:hypothetical protein C8035_v011194 [Colletotrichum spinosum]
MPPRPTAQCCRAVQRTSRTTAEIIWITDSVLLNAFERYCHVSHLSRRTSSSLPGPLESRRRVGKRRMTDMRLDHQSAPPFWVSEPLVDLRKWTWHPPSFRSSKDKEDLQHNERQRDKSSPTRQSLLDWLPRLVAENMRNDEGNTEQSLLNDYPSTDALADKLLQARAAVAASTPDAIQSAFYNFIVGLEQDLKLGVWDSQAVAMAISTFPQSLYDTAADREVVNAGIEMFLSAVVNGVAGSKMMRRRLKAEFWNELLKRVSQLEANDATILLFHTTLHAVPSAHIKHIHEGIIAAVQTLAMSGSLWLTRAADIGAALHKLPPEDESTLFDKLEAAVYASSEVFDAGVRREYRILWLQILSHLPQVGMDYLIDACVRSACFHPDWPGPVGRDLSQLLVQQWHSRRYLHRWKNFKDEWNHELDCNGELSLGKLALRIGELDHSMQSMRLLEKFTTALSRLERRKDLIGELRRICETWETIPVEPFRRIALASQDHRVALDLHVLLQDHEVKTDDSIEASWDWTVWKMYAKQMIDDEHLCTSHVWRQISKDAQWKMLRSEPRRRHMNRKIDLVRDMAVWFSQANHLSDRTALRRVSACLQWLRYYKTDLSPEVVMSLVSVVTREFKRGEFGRTLRINWMLELVEQHRSPKERRELAAVLQRWRSANSELAAQRARGELRRELRGEDQP